MDSDYSTYEEKLSAYLDGALPPEEMAEVAARLETDEKLAALLEKMRRLEELAGQALPAFDEGMLDTLESRIMAGLDDDVEVAEPVKPRTARVIPIWQRYMAVAASIAIIFLVGRMAFKEDSEPLLSPQAPKLIIERKTMSEPEAVPVTEETRETPPAAPGRPEAHDAMKKGEKAKAAIDVEEAITPTPPADEIVIDIEGDDFIPSPQATSAEPGQKQDTDEASMAESRVLLMKDVASSPQAEPDESNPPAEAPMTAAPSPKSSYSVESAMPERQHIKGRIINRETGEPLPGATVSMPGSTTGARTDVDGNYIILDIQPGKKELAVSAVGYESLRIDNVVVGPGETENMNIALEMIPSDIGTTIAVEGARISEAATPSDFRIDGGEPGGSITIPPAVDELRRRLAAGSTEADKSRLNIKSFAATATKSAVEGTTEQRLLDSLTALPVSNDRGVLVERLYLKARIGYVLYLRTEQDDYLDRAGTWRDSLVSHLDYLDRSLPGNAIFRGYRGDLETWDWRR